MTSSHQHLPAARSSVLSPREESTSAHPSFDAAPTALALLHGDNQTHRARAAMQLQQQFGNRAVQRFVSAPVLQRCSCPGCKCADKKDQRVQRSATDTSVHAPAAVADELEKTRHGGEPLGHDVRSKLEPAMNADFSNVRVHTAPYADKLARSVSAEAFTTGSDIYFRNDRYRPNSQSGLHLLSHELTHTVQQSRGPVSGVPHESGVHVSDPHDSFEAEAENTANRTMHVLSKQSAGLSVEPRE